MLQSCRTRIVCYTSVLQGLFIVGYAIGGCRVVVDTLDNPSCDISRVFMHIYRMWMEMCVRGV